MVPILVALIGVTAAAIPLLLDTIINQVYNRPNVNIEITPFAVNGYQKATIVLTNTGVSTANNVSVLIQAPKEILNLTDKWSTTSVILTTANKTLELNVPAQTNKSLIELSIQKFVFGSGSNITLETLINGGKEPIFYNYTANAIYEEGSSKGIVFRSQDPFTQELVRLWGTWSHPYLIVLYYVVIIPVVIIYLNRRRKSRSRLQYIT